MTTDNHFTRYSLGHWLKYLSMKPYEIVHFSLYCETTMYNNIWDDQDYTTASSNQENKRINDLEYATVLFIINIEYQKNNRTFIR